MIGTTGYNLRMLRFMKNLTQIQVAEAIGVKVDTFRRYENNKVEKPLLSVLNKLADFYGVPLFNIIENEKAPLD